jgi:hypothetical protein
MIPNDDKSARQIDNDPLNIEIKRCFQRRKPCKNLYIDVKLVFTYKMKQAIYVNSRVLYQI